MAALRIGTSGWVYRHWRGAFYPEDIPARRWLAYYATRFSTAEINGSFYRLPSEAAVLGWRDGVPADFRFAWKVSRFITHMKKLKDVEDSIALVFGRMAPLVERSGPALVQLPPNMHRNDERLARFLAGVPPGWRVAVEFRHPSWLEPAVLDVLRDHGAALCIHDHADAPTPFEATADFVYIRGHGPSGRYWGRYPDETLRHWADDIRRWQAEGRAVWCFFDNDIGAEAPRDAERLAALLG